MPREVYFNTSEEDFFDRLRTEIDKALDRYEKRRTERPSLGLMTPDEVQKELGVSRGTIYNWTKSGILQGLKLGDKLYYKHEDLVKAFEGRPQPLQIVRTLDEQGLKQDFNAY